MLKYIKFTFLIISLLFSLSVYAWVVPGTIISSTQTWGWWCWSQSCILNYTCACWNAVADSMSCWTYNDSACWDSVADSMDCACWSSYSTNNSTTHYFSSNLSTDSTKSCQVSFIWSYECWNTSCSATTWYNTDMSPNTAYQNSMPSWSSSSHSSSTCSMRWRTATNDSSVPIATLNWVSSVFTSDNDKWCNIKKYRSESWYTYKADENPWCESYRKSNTTENPWIWEDLLKWLEINIPWDVSWIWEVQVRLWNCSKTYKVTNQDITSLINSSWVWYNPNQKNSFTIPYSWNITWWSFMWQSWLLWSFWVTRLDQCLEEWKNSISVLIKDMARSNSDWLVLSANVWAKFTAWTINIDNSNSKLNLTWDLETTSLSWTTVSGGFNGTLSNSWVWRNYSLTGWIKSVEEYRWWAFNECKSFTWSLTWDCNTSSVTPKPSATNWLVWTAPSWVQTDWKFMQFKCDTLGPFPTSAECATWCPTWKEWNANTWKCEAITCKAVVWWVETTIINGTNWVVNADGTCVAYCIPGHSVSCVVKEWWSLAWECWSANGTIDNNSFPLFTSLCNKWVFEKTDEVWIDWTYNWKCKTETSFVDCSAYKSCNLPWGWNILHGQSVTAYKDSIVQLASDCSFEMRTCNYWILSGSYTNPVCGNYCNNQSYVPPPFSRYIVNPPNSSAQRISNLPDTYWWANFVAYRDFYVSEDLHNATFYMASDNYWEVFLDWELLSTTPSNSFETNYSVITKPILTAGLHKVRFVVNNTHKRWWGIFSMQVNGREIWKSDDKWCIE